MFIKQSLLLVFCALTFSGCAQSIPLSERRTMTGVSMSPTIENAQVITLSKDITSIEHGDIIVHQTPPEAKCPKDTDCEFVKRVVGLPGDTVSVSNKKIVLNGKELDEPYLAEQSSTLAGKYIKDRQVTLKDNEYFVLGDNRPYSSDSRAWGPIAKEHILGKVILTKKEL